MKIELTESERKTLLFYLEKAKIDAEGMAAIGMSNGSSAKNIKSIIDKLRIAKLMNRGGN